MYSPVSHSWRLQRSFSWRRSKADEQNAIRDVADAIERGHVPGLTLATDERSWQVVVVEGRAVTPDHPVTVVEHESISGYRHRLAVRAIPRDEIEIEVQKHIWEAGIVPSWGHRRRTSSTRPMSSARTRKDDFTWNTARIGLTPEEAVCKAVPCLHLPVLAPPRGPG